MINELYTPFMQTISEESLHSTLIHRVLQNSNGIAFTVNSKTVQQSQHTFQYHCKTVKLTYSNILLSEQLLL